MKAAVSPYYPPRANWLSKCRSRVAWTVQTLFRNEGAVELVFAGPRLLIAAAIPGAAFVLWGGWGWALAGGAAYLIAFLVWILAVGWPLSGYAFWAMMVLHGAGLLILMRKHCPKLLRTARLLVALCALVAVYSFLQTVLGRLVLPLQTRHGLVLIDLNADPNDVTVGNRIAFKPVRDTLGAANWAYGVDRVLAEAGASITFSSDFFSIDGTAFPKRPSMPDSGEFVVPPGHWFVWRELAGDGTLNLSPAQRKQLVLACMIPKTNFVGSPFRKGIWRSVE